MAPDAFADIERHDDLLIPVGEETMAATRFSPQDRSGPLPIVLMATPYRKDERIVDPAFRYFAAHGYEAVVMDLVGLGASSGVKERSHDVPGEGADIAAAIEWLADREWADGNVGMYGLSYQAFTQLEAAAQDPDPLKAIVPGAIGDSGYSRMYPGGTFDMAGRNGWATMMEAGRALPPSRRDSEGRWRAVWRERLEGLREGTPWIFRFMDHETKDDFWRRAEIDASAISVPTLAVCGYRDFYPLSMLSYIEEIDAPTRFVLGPWGHVYPHQAEIAPIDFRRQAVEWYDRFLKGEDNGALEYPTITYWTELDGASEIRGDEVEDASGVWRGTDRWPRVGGDDGEALSFALSPEGLVPPDSFEGAELAREYDYDHSVGMTWLARGLSPDPDPRADDARALLFETEPLEGAVELTGTPELTLRARATTPDPLVSVQVNDVAPDGRTSLVSGSLMHASHRRSDTDPEPVPPGEEFELAFRLPPRSHVFAPGHRIRLAVTTARFPRMRPPREDGTLTVLSSPESPATLSFPGREHQGGVDFDDTVSMNPPDGDFPIASEYARAMDSGGSASYDMIGKSARYESGRTRTIELPHGPDGATLSSRNETVAEVRADDPESVSVRTEVEMTLDYGHERVRSTAISRLGQDAAFVTTEVTVDGQVVFEERWER